jgi:hypothetical protein
MELDCVGVYRGAIGRERDTGRYRLPLSLHAV